MGGRVLLGSISLYDYRPRGREGRSEGGRKVRACFTYPAKQGDLSGLGHVCAELIVEVRSSHVEKHELNPEGDRVLEAHDIRHVVGCSRLERRGRLDGRLATLNKLADITLLS